MQSGSLVCKDKMATSFLRSGFIRGIRCTRIGQRRSLVARTIPLLDKLTIQVPTMGDSITEGTIVEWTAQVGQAVETDDVVALVETDKVTVEIKAEQSGVITQQYGNVDDTIEVGSDLYELDTEAEPSVDASYEVSPVPPKQKEAAVEDTEAITEPSAAPLLSSSVDTHRVPSIKFLGKEGWAALLSGSSGGSDSTIVEDLSPMFGRPSFSEEEIEALMLGGASLVPDVVTPSHGATFKA